MSSGGGRMWMDARAYGGKVRWNDLFGDLEGQLAAAHTTEFEADVVELAVAERASIDLASRLAAARNATVTFRLTNGAIVRGAVTDATPAWVLLQTGGREHLVPISAIAVAEGLTHRSASATDVERRLSLGHALRALSRDAARVTVESTGGQWRGRIGAVGADHVDLLLEEDRGTVAVMFGAILTVTSN